MAESSGGDAPGIGDEHSERVTEPEVVHDGIHGSELQWQTDIDTFQESHRVATQALNEAIASPSKESIDAANEAIEVARRNSSLLFEKGFHWDDSTPEPGEKSSERTIPLTLTVDAVAKAIEDFDKTAQSLTPHRIGRDPFTGEALATIIEDVEEATNEKDKHEPIARLSAQYSALCTELSEILNRPSILKAKQTGVKQVFSGESGNEWKGKAADLSLIAAGLTIAIMIGNRLSPPRRQD